MRVTARTVIVAAGALGSTEILMRSRDEPYNLCVSRQLGERFSGNGDVIAFAYNGRDRVNGVGLGARSPHGHGGERPGPCITGSILPLVILPVARPGIRVAARRCPA